jgi:LysM repeat protein
MKWKDPGEMVDKQTSTIEEENFDEEQFSPWADQKGQQKQQLLNKTPLLLVLLVAAIAAVVAILLMLVMGGKSTIGAGQLASFDERLKKLEMRLDKYEAIDEKVTRIWEQAKSFEKFKGRFDRTEASMSLRMDHLTMSLETLQKKLAQVQKPVVRSASPKKTAMPKLSENEKYHRVQAGDTIYSISKKYNLTMDHLIRLNRLEPDSVIQPGQKLNVSPSAN